MAEINEESYEDLKQFMDAFTEWSVFKDKEHKIVYANELYISNFGFASLADAVGKRDSQLPCPVKELAEVIQLQQDSVMSSRKAVKKLDIYLLSENKWQANLVTLEPVIDNEHQLLGTLTHGLDIASEPIVQASAILGKMMIGGKGLRRVGEHNYVVDNYFYDVELNREESLVLFLTVHGKRAERIARMLRMSTGEVEDILEVLQEKFLVENKGELIDEAIALGYMHKLPDALFTEQFSLVLDKHFELARSAIAA